MIAMKILGTIAVVSFVSTLICLLLTVETGPRAPEWVKLTGGSSLIAFVLSTLGLVITMIWIA